MTTKTKKSKKKKPNNVDNTDIWLLLGILLFISFSASIYFKNQTGILGEVLGGFSFQLFGAFTYGIPIVILGLVLIKWLNLWGKKSGGVIVYLIVLFFSAMLVVWAKVSPEGSFETSMQMAGEWGRQVIGPGQVGAFLGFGVMSLIGEIGVILLVILILFFFILYIMDWTLTDFFHLLAAFIHWIISSIASFFHRFKDLHDDLDRLDVDTSEDVDKQDQKGLFSKDQKEPVREDTDRILIPDLDSSKENEAVLTPNEGGEEMKGRPKDKRRASKAIPINDYSAKTAFMANQISEEEKSSSSDGVKKDEKTKKTPSRTNANVKKEAKAKDKGEKEAGEENLEINEASQKPYVIPPIELLNSPKAASKVDPSLLKKQARIIEKTLESFNIESEVVAIRRGPTVTLFEVKPQSGIKVSKITNLSDNLAMALAAPVVRIEAPIPGKPYVGIEVPNPKADPVSFYQMIQSEAFQTADKEIPVALGQSIDGEPVIAKIAKMPHLLIAGATGSGKSVCINTIIMSVLYKYSPKDLRMILIDPKVVELSVYNGIPHLLIPVVTDPKKASQALYTAVQEMERRFRLFSKNSVRDFAGYHEKLKVDDSLENLPLILVIIDELSDLMMVASKDVESHITRLAQMARACGIHLIIATQRPSVDVITGTIKANIPSRISFQVSSATDSRTILDQGGAEKLLGKGDMLYYPASFPKPLRVQGSFVTDAEVEKVVDFVKKSNDAQYDKKFVQSIEKAQEASNTGRPDPSEQDELMDDVIEFISNEETTSISGLQRRFRIGYARAGRIIDDLEAMGAVSEQDGSKPRQVLINADKNDEEIENGDIEDESAQ